MSVLDNPDDVPPHEDTNPQQSNHRYRRSTNSLPKSSVQTRSASGISSEESSFFSVGEDNTVICWDEYDRSERFSFRLKESGVVRYFL